MKKAHVLWFTGLSGSGKTTLSRILLSKLTQKSYQAKLMDGDEVRKQFHPHLGFSKENIIANNSFITHLCIQAQPFFDFILVSAISPLKEVRAYAREKLQPLFSEIYIKTSLEECMKRDVKGLYKKAIEGDIPNLIGFNKGIPYEAPQTPELILNTEFLDSTQCIQQLLNHLNFTP